MQSLNYYYFCFKFYVIIFFLWKINSVLTPFVFKRIKDFFQFLYIQAQLWQHIENVYYHHFSYLLLHSFKQSGESMYEPPRLKFILWHLQYIKLTQSKIKSPLLIVVSKLIWYFERSDKKFSNNFINTIKSHNLYVITFWMHCTLFIDIFRKKKFNCNC